MLNELEKVKANNEALSNTIKEYETRYANVDKEMDSMRSEINRYKTDLVKTDIAKEVGIPYEMRDRLRGETADEIRADAEALKKLMPIPSAPARMSEPVKGSEDALENAFKTMIIKD